MAVSIKLDLWTLKRENDMKFTGDKIFFSTIQNVKKKKKNLQAIQKQAVAAFGLWAMVCKPVLSSTAPKTPDHSPLPSEILYSTFSI